MIYTLSVKCVWGAYLKQQCKRVIEIGDDSDLYTLHDIIQDSVKFERDHPFGYFLAHTYRGAKEWLCTDEGWEAQETFYFETELRAVFPTGRRHLYYVFDFGDQWTFEIRKSRGSKSPVTGIVYPRVIESFGPNPIQYPSQDD